MNKKPIFFREAIAKMKVSDETREKFARIRKRMKEKGARQFPLSKLMKEE